MKQRTEIESLTLTARKGVRRFGLHSQFSKTLRRNGASRSREQAAMIDQRLSPLCKVVDELGKGVIIATRDGQVVLATNRAKQWARTYFQARSLGVPHLPEEAEQWVKNQKTRLRRKCGLGQACEPLVLPRGAKRLVVRLLPDLHHTVLVLEEQGGSLLPECLECLGLTRRQAEVLNWVAKGKTSAEIGTILGRSGRTVSKHLEHIYQALGVENRTEAAMRCLLFASPQQTEKNSRIASAQPV